MLAKTHSGRTKWQQCHGVLGLADSPSPSISEHCVFVAVPAGLHSNQISYCQKMVLANECPFHHTKWRALIGFSRVRFLSALSNEVGRTVQVVDVLWNHLGRISALFPYNFGRISVRNRCRTDFAPISNRSRTDFKLISN